MAHQFLFVNEYSFCLCRHCQLARASSYIFDSLIGNQISQALQETFSLHLLYSWPYADFFALGLTLLMTGEKGLNNRMGRAGCGWGWCRKGMTWQNGGGLEIEEQLRDRS